jgi:hypothetical protein
VDPSDQILASPQLPPRPEKTQLPSKLHERGFDGSLITSLCTGVIAA